MTSPSTLTDVIDRYCRAWSDPEAEHRTELLALVGAEGATYSAPTVYKLDKGSLLEHISKIQSKRPGARVLRTSEVDSHHTFARFAFAVFDREGKVLRHGMDAVYLNEEGTKIEHIVGFFSMLEGNESFAHIAENNEPPNSAL